MIDILLHIASVIGIMLALVMIAAGLIWLERRVLALWQDRYGPNRTGPFGTLQVVADMVKIFMKEDWIPKFADKKVFVVAPAILMISILLSFAVIPFTPEIGVVDLNIGLLFFLGMSSFGAYSIVLAGWSSNNKYSLIGAVRAASQMISYEVFMGLSLMGVVMLAGSFNMRDIVMAQQGRWFFIPQFLGFVIFFIAGIAETRRLPFDIPEAESELVAGYHSEYSGMKFALFFLAEYVNVFIVCAIGATLFLGGWMPFHIGNWQSFNHVMDYIPSSIWFFGKTFFLIFVIMWFRWTFPRLRIDQLLNLEWKYLLPISMFNILLVTLIAIMGWHF